MKKPWYIAYVVREVEEGKFFASEVETRPSEPVNGVRMSVIRTRRGSSFDEENVPTACLHLLREYADKRAGELTTEHDALIVFARSVMASYRASTSAVVLQAFERLPPKLQKIIGLDGTDSRKNEEQP